MMDLVKQPFLVGDSLLLGDSPFLILLGLSEISWVPFWGFSLGFISLQSLS